MLLVNTAVQLEFAVNANCELTGLVPVHVPIHPVNVEPASAVAVRVTGVFRLNTPVQVPPQEIPAGEDDTVPEPVPDLTTVNAGWVALKLAVQSVFAPMASAAFAEVPVQAPDQPRKVEPAGTAATSLTTVPGTKSAAQAAPQEMPAGVDVIGPAPLPAAFTDKVASAPKVNNALQVEFAVMAICVLGDDPVQLPAQPANIDPEFAVAVNAIGVLAATLVEHAVPHEIPEGEELTVPVPVPELATVSVINTAAEEVGEGRENEELGDAVLVSTEALPPPQPESNKHSETRQDGRKIDVFRWPPFEWE